MKSIRYSWGALFLLLSLFSCQQINQEDSLSQLDASKDRRIYFTMQTPALRATENNAQTATLAAQDNEKKIDDVTVVVFDKLGTKVVKVIPSPAIAFTNEGDKSQGGYFELDLGSEYKVHFIANAPADLLPRITNNMTVAAFNKLVVGTTAPVHGDDNFIMLSKEPKDVNLIAGSTVHLGAITLSRLAARIDIYNTVPGFEMTEITLDKRQNKSFLVADASNNSPGSASDTYKVLQSTSSSWFTSKEAVAGLYTYEQSQDQSNQFKVLVKGIFNGKNINLEIPLKKENGTNILLKRNYLYRIVIDTQGVPPGPHITEGFKFNIQVLDWNNTTPAFVHDDDALDIVKESITGKGTPVSYMAQYDVKDLTGTSTSWDKLNDTYDFLKNLKWQPVFDAYAEGKVIDGKKYYLPTKEEWLAIIPGDATNIFKNQTTEVKMPLGPTPQVQFGGKTYTMKGKLYAFGAPGAVSFREVYGAFVYTPTEPRKETLYVIASYVWGLHDFDPSSGKNMRNGLEVKMAKVNKATFDKLKGAADENPGVGLGGGIKTKFSTLPASAYESRLFRAIGYWNGVDFTQMGVGYYWTATKTGPYFAWNACCFQGSAYVGINSCDYGFRVRLFARD
ncbi:fimbrial protein [Porphyromonas crevioricanis]|uniref:Cadherin domain-containing protein n=1 Tax=Porphyromonas crevioricanis TaxID=393921 RepID=A0AB34PIG1_9PORP|nr:fimbrial protein [Porphyromonas crevioricanis]KGN96839.1 hypothetical protein HQ38_00720 [Porphyromonas crevioricanis]